MSRDLLLVTHERPEVPASADWEADGPTHVESEDLDDALAAAVLAPRWLVEFHVPHSASKAAWSRLCKAARALAESCHGAVYDPQEDAVLWPRGARRVVVPSEEARIRVVQLEWFQARSRCSPENAGEFLAAVSRRLPEARPTRFGEYEPMRGRLEPGEDGPFRDLVEKQLAIPYGDSFFWKATRPCLGGSFYLSDPRPHPRRPERLPTPATWKMDFDARPLEGDPRWSNAVVDLFVGVAEVLGAFYGAATVQRDVISRRGNTWYDAKTEDVNIRTGALECRPWWQGLPSISTWLAWFGAPYRDAVVSAIGAAEAHGEGLLLRCGPAPLDGDQLSGVFPALPERLVARGRPAEVIPPIG